MREDHPNPPSDMPAAIKQEAQQWLVLLTSGRATAADAAALKRWCERSELHAQAFAEANLLWDGIASASRRPQRGFVSRRAIFAGAGASAAAAALGYFIVKPPLALWPSASELRADLRTTTGERRRIALQSGASIDVNTRTSLNMPHAAGEGPLELVSGEVAIVTSKPLDTPLTIMAAGGRIRAVDAHFDVRCDGVRATVTCERGSVAIDYSGNSVTLHEGRQIAYTQGALEPVVAADVGALLAWREGQLVFRQTPLSEVIGEVNRYRPGHIVLMNETLGRRLVEVRIALDHIDDLIVLIREVYGAHITQLPGGVVVVS
ncbi:FecR domain-containing protein [Microbacteriaceae bacterium K1510]|nr:FecR domain-containing protein [Microbacteriaceae bacterium K1510]